MHLVANGYGITLLPEMAAEVGGDRPGQLVRFAANRSRCGPSASPGGVPRQDALTLRRWRGCSGRFAHERDPLPPGVALAIGLLIGLERGWRQREEAEGERTAGFRTYTLAALLGGVSAALASDAGPVFLGFSFFAFSLGFSAFAWLEARAERNFSVTGVVAAMLTFALGAYAVLGEVQVAVAGGVAVTLMLALKQPLHSWLRTLTWIEIRAALTLLAMTFLALPLLPDRPVDPLRAPSTRPRSGSSPSSSPGSRSWAMWPCGSWTASAGIALVALAGRACLLDRHRP